VHPTRDDLTNKGYKLKEWGSATVVYNPSTEEDCVDDILSATETVPGPVDTPQDSFVLLGRNLDKSMNATTKFPHREGVLVTPGPKQRKIWDWKQLLDHAKKDYKFLGSF
jgi:hypothetical protein